MPVSANVYANAYSQAFSGSINWGSDTIKIGLLGSGYTPNLTGHVHWSDVSANEITGTGYTAGGATLSSKTNTVTAASSWATANGNFTGGTWLASTVAAAGNVIRPATANGYLYVCVTAGTTGSTAPTWPTVQGQTVTDGTATWSCVGESITVLSSSSVSWSTATISANYAAIYDAQTGTASTEPLIALINFGGAVSSTASTFQVTVPALGWAWNTPA